MKPLVLLCCMASPVAAEQFGDFTYTDNGASITITNYTGAGGVVTLPDTIKDLPVVGIGSSAFSYRFNLTSIVIPPSVTSIDQNAFAGCHDLTSIAIPASVTFIGQYALHSCNSLTAIAVDAGNTHFSSLDGVLSIKT